MRGSGSRRTSRSRGAAPSAVPSGARARPGRRAGRSHGGTRTARRAGGLRIRGAVPPRWRQRASGARASGRRAALARSARQLFERAPASDWMGAAAMLAGVACWGALLTLLGG
jgi:hypothetical protein